LITDDGLRLTLDRDMTVGIEPIDFGITARTLGRAVMCGQGIGVDLGRPALSDSVPAGDVNLRVLLPFDARFSRNFDGPILRYTAEAQALGKGGRPTQPTANKQRGEQRQHSLAGSSDILRDAAPEEAVSRHPLLP